MSPLLAEMFLESTYCAEPAGDSLTRKGEQRARLCVAHSYAV